MLSKCFLKGEGGVYSQNLLDMYRALYDAKKEKAQEKGNDDTSVEMLAGIHTHARIAKNNAYATALAPHPPPPLK